MKNQFFFTSITASITAGGQTDVPDIWVGDLKVNLSQHKAKILTLSIKIFALKSYRNEIFSSQNQKDPISWFCLMRPSSYKLDADLPPGLQVNPCSPYKEAIGLDRKG